MPAIDVFVDFSRVAADVDPAETLARMASPEMLGAVAERVTCVVRSAHARLSDLPLGPAWRFHTTDAVEACGRAMTAAAEADRALLVVIGAIEPGCDAVGLLMDAMDADPMIGFALPRLTGSGDDSLATVDRGGDAAVDDLPRRLLAELPPTYFIADTAARCLLLKPIVLANFGELDTRFRTLPGALWEYMGRARRCGFRTLVCNRAVVTTSSAERPSPPCTIPLRALPEADRVLLRELMPDVERTHEEFGAGVLAPAETRLARGLPLAYGTKPSLLLDIRNVLPGMNGTAIAALGICGGLHALDAEWDVTLLALKEASAYHEMERLFPNWHVRTKLPDRQFTAALRLSQPWLIQQMVDLHEAAAFNAYLFLDTISWDIAYPAPRHLDGTWRFMADYADGFLFISEFTRDRFVRRFPSGADVPGLVSYLSFSPADYVHPDVKPVLRPATRPAADDFIFIVGNEYDHKDVSRTIELLTTAFPYQSIVALGPAKAASPRVTVLESGTLSELEIHRLYANARAVVFPSFYEGFGFPILTTLAYGGTLLARRSTLLDEVAARCAPRGRLVPFDRRDALVELIGRLLHGEPVPELPLGTALDRGQPLSWQDVGRGIVNFLSTLTSDLSRSRWRAREHAIRQLMAAPLSLVDTGLKSRNASENTHA
jgi:glycosyltransferase involved in cell wall biosynthesis